MSGRQWTTPEAIREQHTLYLKAQPTTLRRCLCCGEWMHSTGVDHRICNPCKGEPDYTDSPVGKRLHQANRRKGRRHVGRGLGD